VSVIETVGLHWCSFRNRFFDLVFPPRCVDCRRVGTWLCAECLSRVPLVEHPLCSCCGGAVAADGLCARCRTSPLQVERIRSVVYFEGAVREAIHQFKYNGRTALVEPLVDLMVAYWMKHPMSVDVVVPVPLHAARLRERGYNQAALLARELARRIGLPLNERVLMRQRATSPQVGLDATQRRENVRAAFSCSGNDLAGRRVLLIDDVCTTGATLEACAVALHEGGADSVQALTLARAH
jgi:ComF family protein